MKFTRIIAIAALLAVMVAGSAFAFDAKIGTFTSQDAGVKAIGSRIPSIEVGFTIDQDKFSKTTLVSNLAYAMEVFNQDDSFLKAGIGIDKTFTVGDPDNKISPYVGAGAGFYYINGLGDSDADFGTSLIGGLKLGDNFTVETKYTDVRKSTAGDGFTVTLGARF